MLTPSGKTACLLALAIVVFLSPVSVAATDPFLLNDFALSLLQQGETEKSLEQLQKAFSLFPYDLTLRRNLAEVYTVIGHKRMVTGKYEDAATSFDNASELFPDVQRYIVLRAIALYSAKQYDAAIVELERAKGVGEDTPDILYYLGRSQYDSGNLRAALESWDKLLEMQPGRKDTVTLLAKVRRELAVEERMERGFSSRFMISFDSGEKAQLADKVLDVLESAYNRVGSDLNYFPVARIPVLIYTRMDYRNVTNSPEWSGALYDGKIRLPIGSAVEVNELLQSILYHEYTHVVVQEITSGHCPVWLNEGLAELEGRKTISPPLNELSNAVKNGTLFTITELENSFTSMKAKDATLAYQQSYSFVSYIVSAYGWHKIKDILLALGTGMKIDKAIAVSLADLSVDYASLYQEWLDSVQNKYGR